MTFPEIANDMFWNWRTSGLTVVFPFWKVVSGLDFLSTLIFVFSLSVLWEYMQYVNFKMENYCANSILERTRSMIPGISSSAAQSWNSNTPTRYFGKIDSQHLNPEWKLK
ncbi:hypothetical protein HMI55_001862 [Coelomomyces lativittatus]|nr:hypothetical protein HMI55_001862 [Coelomomyces lativittatus]